MPKTVRELINEAYGAVDIALASYNTASLREAHRDLEKVTDILDNGGSLETVVRG
jgi:hypothetical protein